MAAHVTSTGFDADGVRLITPADVEFDALLETLAAPGWAQTLRQAAPSIVIVANETDQKIVALSTRFSVAGGPQQGTNSVFFVAPDAIAATELDYGRASSKGIPPGREQMIGFDFAVPDREYASGFTQEESDFYDPQVRNWIQTTARKVASARTLHVTFDAVIFDSGRLLGDPSSLLATHFDALVQARQNVYRTVLDKLEAGQSADEVTKRLWPAEELGDSAQLTTEWHAMNEARNAVATLLEKYGSDGLASVLRRALVPQPFVIRKSTSV
jgi:hypothetical protein